MHPGPGRRARPRRAGEHDCRRRSAGAHHYQRRRRRRRRRCPTAVTVTALHPCCPAPPFKHRAHVEHRAGLLAFALVAATWFATLSRLPVQHCSKTEGCAGFSVEQNVCFGGSVKLMHFKTKVPFRGANETDGTCVCVCVCPPPPPPPPTIHMSSYLTNTALLRVSCDL